MTFSKVKIIRRGAYELASGCLVWKDSVDRHGYPQMNLQGKTYRVHRFLLELKLGRQLDLDQFACHKCNNRRCISTAKDHIYCGNRSQNTIDSVHAGTFSSKGHGGVRKTRKPWKM